MWAVGQNWNILAAYATIEVARFASCICSPSDEEPTDFISHHTFFILNVLFDRTRQRGWLVSDSSALLSLVSAACGLKGAGPCPKCWRTGSNSVHKKIQWREENYRSYDIRSETLTSHERIQNLCSFFCTNWAAQCHQLMSSGTNWSSCRINGKMVSTIQRGTHKEPNLKYPLFQFTITIVKSLLQQFSAPLAASKFNWAWLLTR